MRATRLGGRSRRRVAQLLVLAVMAAAGALAFGAAPALAAGSWTCQGSAAGDAGLQGLITPGGTVTIYGPLPCVGNFSVTANTTIQAGTPTATLDGNGTGAVLAVSGGASLTLRHLKITNGSTSGGGGVDVACCGSTLNLTNTQVTGNVADFAGGVFIDDGTINAVASAVSGNSASSGGGIYAQDFATVNLTNSSVSGNTNGTGGAGGGLFVTDNSTATLTGATVSNNQGAYEGGGILVAGGSTLQATASTITHNQTTEILNVYGGGGIWMQDAQVSLDSTTVSWNTSADYGGGIAYYGHNAHQMAGLTVTNSSIDHNTAAFSGGGLYSKAESGPATVSLDHTTVAFNRVLDGDGGGISNYGDCGNTASLLATSSAFGGNLATTRRGRRDLQLERHGRLRQQRRARDAGEDVRGPHQGHHRPGQGPLRRGHLQRERRRLLERVASVADGRGRKPRARQRRRRVQLRWVDVVDRAGRSPDVEPAEQPGQHAALPSLTRS